VAKKVVKEEDGGGGWDAPRKRNIDEWGSSRTKDDPGRSRNDSRQSSGEGGRAARAGFDDDWDSVHSPSAAAQPVKSRIKVLL
jgi:hypothetical protein